LSTRRSDVRTRKRKPSVLEKADNQIEKLEVSMDKCTQFLPFLQALFDDPAVAQKAGMIVGWITKTAHPGCVTLLGSSFVDYSSNCIKSIEKE
jgi:hypothetical protein